MLSEKWFQYLIYVVEEKSHCIYIITLQLFTSGISLLAKKSLHEERNAHVSSCKESL